MQTVKDGTTGEVLYREQHCPLVHDAGGNANNIAFTCAADAFRHVINQIATSYISKGRGDSGWCGISWAVIDNRRVGYIGMVRYVEKTHSLEFSFFNAGREDHAVFHAWCAGGKVGCWEADVLMRMNAVAGAADGRNLIVVSAANLDRAIEILVKRTVRH